MKRLRVTKIVKEIKFEGVRSDLDGKNILERQSFTKYLRLTLVFMSNRVQQEKFNNFCLLVLRKFLFWQEYWAVVGYHSMRF